MIIINKVNILRHSPRYPQEWHPHEHTHAHGTTQVTMVSVQKQTIFKQK